MVMDALGTDEVTWGGTETKTRTGCQEEKLRGENLSRVGKEEENTKEWPNRQRFEPTLK